MSFISSAWQATTAPVMHEAKLSQEFRRACDAQLRHLQTALRACKGTHDRIGNFSVFVRVPSSFEMGDLSLQRVAFRSDSDMGMGFDTHAESETLVELRQDGTPEAQHVIEDWLNQQSSFELPGETESIVFPLTFMPQHQAWTQSGPEGRIGDTGTLLGLLVVEGIDVRPPSPPCEAPEDSEVIRQPPVALAPAASVGVRSSSTAPPPKQQVAGLLLEQACECLVMTCALELRLYLERATLVATHQKARSLVDEARKPLSVLRTFGNMLQLRTPKGQLEGDMAEGIMVQGDQLHAVLTQLAHALHSYPTTVSTQQIISGRRHKSDGSRAAD